MARVVKKLQLVAMEAVPVAEAEVHGNKEHGEPAENGNVGAQRCRRPGNVHMGGAYEITLRFVPRCGELSHSARNSLARL
jgi:hypothetical protein